ncbi:MAG: NYN domain-containing protein [Cyanobacteria bacterium J06643_13]
MTNLIYLDRVSNPSPSHSLPQLPTKSLKKAGKIALLSSLFCTCAISLRQQPLLSLPVSALVGLNLHSRQQQTQLEKKLSFTNARLETIHNQYSQLGTSELQQIEQIQQQLNNFSDRLNTVSQERNTSVTPEKKRVAIFIDGSNLYYALNKLNTRIDYTKLLKLLVGEDTLYRAIYYTGIDSSSNKEHGFVS